MHLQGKTQFVDGGLVIHAFSMINKILFLCGVVWCGAYFSRNRTACKGCGKAFLEQAA